MRIFWTKYSLSHNESANNEFVHHFYFVAQSVEAVEYADYASAQGLTSSCNKCRGALGNVEYPFIFITPRSTLNWSRSARWDPIYLTVYCTWNQLTVYKPMIIHVKMNY